MVISSLIWLLSAFCDFMHAQKLPDEINCSIRFSNGELSNVTAKGLSDFELGKLSKHVKKVHSPALKEVVLSMIEKSTFDDASIERLMCPLLADIVPKAMYEQNLDAKSQHFRSVITRLEGGANARYAQIVHRDLDEIAAENLNSHSHLYNIWIPFSPVTTFPLGFIDPSTVNLIEDSAPFLTSAAIGHDRTGLNFQRKHAWYFAQNLVIGDCLIWKSDLVYHAALDFPGKEFRSSIDIRLSFNQKKDGVCNDT